MSGMEYLCLARSWRDQCTSPSTPSTISSTLRNGRSPVPSRTCPQSCGGGSPCLLWAQGLQLWLSCRYPGVGCILFLGSRRQFPEGSIPLSWRWHRREGSFRDGPGEYQRWLGRMVYRRRGSRSWCAAASVRRRDRRVSSRPEFVGCPLLLWMPGRCDWLTWSRPPYLDMYIYSFIFPKYFFSFQLIKSEINLFSDLHSNQSPNIKSKMHVSFHLLSWFNDKWRKG